MKEVKLLIHFLLEGDESESHIYFEVADDYYPETLSEISFAFESSKKFCFINFGIDLSKVKYYWIGVAE